MRAASQRRLTPVLVMIAALLAAIFATLLAGAGTGVHWQAPHGPAALPPAGSGVALPPPLPLDHFALVWQKPLFNPDRRPTVQAAGEGVGDLQLTGIIITPTLRMVLVHDTGHDHDLQLEQGKATPDGRWSVVEVRPRSAVFDSPNGRVELKLPAGAPFTGQKKDDAGSQHDGGDAPPPEDTPPPAGRRMGLSPNAGRSQRPHLTKEQLQVQRVRRLNAVIQKRRAEPADSARKGAR